MGIFDRFRTNLADNPSKQKPLPNGSAGEIGVWGESVFNGFKDEETRTDKISPKKYNNMRQTDGTVAALYSILTLPILSNGYRIDADVDDNGEAQAEFVRKNLLEPERKGGMSTPFPLVIGQMLRATLEGFALFEKVWKVQDGAVVLDKLAHRDASSVKLRRDKKGGYDGADQRVYWQTEYIDVTIPAAKTLLFTYGKDKSFLYGESAFKAAYYHWDTKRRLYYLSNLAVQVMALPPRVLSRDINNSTSTGKNSGDDRAKASKAMSAIDKIGSGRTTVYIPAGFKLDAFKGADGRIDPLPLIEHHNAEMARSVLAQFIMLGTQSGSVGSWALSSDQSDLFIMALKGLMKNIEDHINNFIIPDLVDYNFANPAYPEFHFDDMTAENRETIKEAFIKLIEKGMLSDAMASGILEKVASQLRIDTEQIQKDLENGDAASGGTKPKSGVGGTTPPAGGSGDGSGSGSGDGSGSTDPQPVDKNGKPIANQADQKKKTSHDCFSHVHFDDTNWFRALTVAERRVQFGAIQKKLNTLESDFVTEVEPLWLKIKDDVITRLTPLLENKDLNALDSFDLRYGNEYKALIVGAMKDAYEFAKKGAADELGVSAPATKVDTRTLIAQNAQSVVDKQFADLLFALKSEIIKAQRKNLLSEDLSVGDVLAAIGAVFDGFFDSKISVTGGIIVAQSINRGRNDVFTTAKSKISRYQYSAILDGATCPICRDLDGSVVPYEQYLATPWEPPIHLNCRCIWVAIKKDQTEQPDFLPIPDMPGGIDSPIL